jgi:hypothetical protein
MIALAVIAIIVGALEVAGGMQELVVQGILNNRTYPLVGGTLGAIAGAFVLTAGVAVFRRSASVRSLIQVAVAVSLPVFLLIGIIRPLAGGTVTLLGLAVPLLLLAALPRLPSSRVSDREAHGVAP